MTWTLLAFAVTCEVAASLSLKASEHHPALYAVVVAGYVTAFVVLTKLLQRGASLTVVYGIWSAGGIALTAVMSAVIFGEPLTAMMTLGISFIILGVILIQTGVQRPSSDGRQQAEQEIRTQ